MTFFNDGKTTLKILLIKIILRPPAGFTEQSELIKNSVCPTRRIVRREPEPCLPVKKMKSEFAEKLWRPIFLFIKIFFLFNFIYLIKY